MKKLFRFALAALATAALFVSCEEKLEPEQKPDDKDQKVELKGISLDKTTASVKVGETASFKVLYNPDNATEKPEATWASDTPAVATVAGGVVTGVAAGEAKITATVGTFTATATVTVTEDVIPSKYPLDLVDWDNLNPDYLVSMELPEGAAMTGLKSAKVYYDDKLYILAEISDEAIADGKVRMHVYFDVDNTGGLQQHWNKPVIDYMTEGKITNGGAYVSYSSTLYKWDGTPEDPWKWADSGLAPTCVGGGKDNLYEMSLDYSAFADKMPVAFNLGLDVVNSSWATFGFLPSVAEGTPKLARMVKAGQTDPGEEPEDLWDYTPGAEYLADNNLWKAAVGNEKYFSYMNIAQDWSNAKYDNVEAAEFPFLSFDQSTYRLYFADQTFDRWQNQFYIFPGDESHFVGLQANHVYSLKLTVSASAPLNAFFKFSQYIPEGPKHEGAAIWEPAGYPNNIVIANAYDQVVLENEITGVTCDNILLLFDFGGNAANNYVYIKDVVLVDKGVAEKVYFQDDFEWAAEWATATNAPDDVANNSVGSSPNVFTKAELKPFLEELQNRGYGYVWGWKDQEWSDGTPDSGNKQTMYLNKNYLKFGKTDYSSGIILPALASIEGTDNIELSFDWCWCMTGNSKADLTNLTVVISGGGTFANGTTASDKIVSNQPNEGENNLTKLEWQHATLSITGATAETRLTIRPTNYDPNVDNPVRRQQRWYLDNIKVIAAQ